MAALRSFEVGRLALINPPWFLEETDALGAEYFRAQGIDVVHHAPAELEFGELPSGQVAIEPGSLFEWVKTHTPDDADAVYIGGNGFRAIGAIGALEAELGLGEPRPLQALLGLQHPAVGADLLEVGSLARSAGPVGWLVDSDRIRSLPLTAPATCLESRFVRGDTPGQA